MRIDKNNKNHLIANVGKVLHRISDGWISGKEVFLGYAYQLGGELLVEPLLELPEHYEEVDEALLEDIPDEAFDVPAELEVVALLADEVIPVELAERPTLADLLSRAFTEIEGLKKEVNDLKNGSNSRSIETNQ